MIRLEGFSGEVKNKKSLVITSPQYKQPDFQDFFSGAASDRTLLLHGKKAFDPLSYHWLQWSAIMNISTSTDWSFALNYLNTSQKQSVCFIDQTLSVPDLFLHKLTPTTTFMHFHDVAQPLPLVLNIYDYVFLPVTPVDTLINIIQNHSHFKSFGDLKEIFREISVAGLGLVWSREDNMLYWYEAGSKPQIDLHPKQIGNILISIGQTMM